MYGERGDRVGCREVSRVCTESGHMGVLVWRMGIKHGERGTTRKGKVRQENENRHIYVRREMKTTKRIE